ncbi:nitroreductase family protein [Herpetosiphon giganteus]|uniref:nitroreductase family protein n=1 Tax=Herpetosiphon giganteus TaxID=2029754 RepID=UPI00195A96FC|nr:nitroreductase family protein [Herpetosiphon giganteus]MBM7841532.1 nitroreductase [Herpetosiphon giganteus]
MTQPAVNNVLSVADAINSRRSVRKYTNDQVSQADLKTILELTGKAPSAWNIQPWRFVAVRNQEVKNKLQAAAYGQGQVGSAPVVIAVYSDTTDALANLADVIHPGVPAEQRQGAIDGVLGAFAHRSQEQKEAWGLGQTNIALGYLSLVARSLGYDTSLMLGFDPAQVKEILGLPEHVQLAGLVSLGVAAEEGYPHHRHEVEKITQFID